MKWAASWGNQIFADAKKKTQISFAITAKLISAFVFATRIVQSLYFLNPKFQASNHLLWLYSPVSVRPGRKSRRPVFSQRGSNDPCSWPYSYSTGGNQHIPAEILLFEVLRASPFISDLLSTQNFVGRAFISCHILFVTWKCTITKALLFLLLSGRLKKTEIGSKHCNEKSCIANN